MMAFELAVHLIKSNKKNAVFLAVQVFFLTTILLIGSAFTTHLQDQNREDTLDSRRSVYYIEGQNGSGTYYRDFSLQDVETMNQKVRHGNPFVRYRTMSLGLVDEQDSNLIHTYHAIVYSGDIRSIVISQPDIIVPQEGLIADHTFMDRLRNNIEARGDFLRFQGFGFSKLGHDHIYSNNDIKVPIILQDNTAVDVATLDCFNYEKLELEPIPISMCVFVPEKYGLFNDPQAYYHIAFSDASSKDIDVDTLNEILEYLNHKTNGQFQFKVINPLTKMISLREESIGLLKVVYILGLIALAILFVGLLGNNLLLLDRYESEFAIQVTFGATSQFISHVVTLHNMILIIPVNILAYIVTEILLYVLRRNQFYPVRIEGRTQILVAAFWAILILSIHILIRLRNQKWQFSKILREEGENA